MKNRLILTLKFLLLTLISSNCHAESIEKCLKPRLVVMTDICPADLEPDDMESAIRLMAYADQIEIEAIMTTVGWNCDPYPEEWVKYLNQVTDAYGKDVDNIKKRSGQNGFQSLEKENGKQKIGYWPSVEYIRSRCMSGSHKAGIKVIGEGNDSEGSEFLIRLADEDDPRPIWVATWGSGNTLAQAIWKVQQTRSAEQFREFLHKFRVYTITDQDMVYNMRMNRAYSSHMWMRKEFKDDLKFIWDEGTWQEQCELGKRNWERHQQMIQGKGTLGNIYPNYKWGVEGDTPSFLYVMPNGLHDPEDPKQSCWAGTHTFSLCADSLTYAWTSWNEPMRTLTVAVKDYFYHDELNDFCARMQWAAEGKGNHNPIIRINEQVVVSEPITIKVHSGEKIVLDASGSTDSDGDILSFTWLQDKHGININNQKMADGPKLTLQYNEEQKGQTLHYICRVTDNGQIPLTSYARVIIEID